MPKKEGPRQRGTILVVALERGSAEAWDTARFTRDGDSLFHNTGGLEDPAKR